MPIRTRWILYGFVLVTMVAGVQDARACPACKVAAAGMADDEISGPARRLLEAPPEPVVASTRPPAGQSSTSSQPESPGADPVKKQGRVHLAFGFDFVNAYFHRGYLQQDEGMILQPYTVLSYTLLQDDRRDLTVRPYVGMWNSFQDGPSEGARYGHGGSPKVVQKQKLIWENAHPGIPYRHYHIYLVDEIEGGDGQGWYEVDLMAGTTFNWRAWTLDVQYHAHIFPSGPHDMVQELGGKLAYDLMDLSDHKGSASRDFSLTPSIGVWRELKNDNGDESTYVEASIEPAWRTKLGKWRVGFSTPITLGTSPDGYYTQSDGEDSPWGYVSASAKVSVGLPIPRKYGQWFFNTSVTYMNLLAESARYANGGEPNEWIGSVGISVRF